MSQTPKTTNKSELEKAYDRVLTYMENLDPDSVEYAQSLDQLEKLHAMLAPNKESIMKPEALIALIGNLAGIILILQHESVNVVTSKALGFVMKPKV